MKEEVRSKLDKLQNNYSQTAGHSFSHFFCPILFRDDETELCKAHIVNSAFPNSSRAWTIQRRDVDNFYGSNFESEFISMQYKYDWHPSEVLTDSKLSKRFKPTITVDNEPVDYFISQGEIPKEFTRLQVEANGNFVELGLKMLPNDFLSKVDQQWEFEISKDIRVAAMVSLLKMAHLTLFELLGYQYALSSGGYFVGRHILGEFFNQNHLLGKNKIVENALGFFREFAHMVRPVQAFEIPLEGTIADRLFLLCKRENNSYCALIVFIKIMDSLHAVMIPIFDHPDSVNRFIGFLKNKAELIEVSFCRFQENHWELDKTAQTMSWPKSGILYPE